MFTYLLTYLLTYYNTRVLTKEMPLISSHAHAQSCRLLTAMAKTIIISTAKSLAREALLCNVF